MLATLPNDARSVRCGLRQALRGSLSTASDAFISIVRATGPVLLDVLHRHGGNDNGSVADLQQLRGCADYMGHDEPTAQVFVWCIHIVNVLVQATHAHATDAHISAFITHRRLPTSDVERGLGQPLAGKLSSLITTSRAKLVDVKMGSLFCEVQTAAKAEATTPLATLTVARSILTQMNAIEPDHERTAQVSATISELEASFMTLGAGREDDTSDVAACMKCLDACKGLVVIDGVDLFLEEPTSLLHPTAWFMRLNGSANC